MLASASRRLPGHALPRGCRTVQTMDPSRKVARRRRSFAGGCAAVALVLGACSDGDSRSGTSAPPNGADLYRTSCASCHGADLRGTDQGPSHLSQVYEPSHHPDEAFRSAITQGSPAHHWDFGDMPPIEGLSDDEIDQIIAYIRHEQATQGFEPYPPE